MRVVVIVNEFETLVPTQTTAMLIRAWARSAEVWVVGVEGLAIDADGAPLAYARHAPDGLSLAGLVDTLRAGSSSRVDLTRVDLLAIRTNPARDHAREGHHRAALDIARLARGAGTNVCNDPDGLLTTGTKLFLSTLPPAVRPRTLVASAPDAVVEFVEATGRCVIKPAVGTRGEGVFTVSPGDPNLRALIALLGARGPIVCQEFVPAAVDGDTRVVVLDGVILSTDGDAAAIRRRPPTGDFRSNLHVGGVAAKAEITDAMRSVVSIVGPRLSALGVRLSGLDFIGDVLCEINVYATGGLRDAERFTGRDFTATVAAALLRAPAT